MVIVPLPDLDEVAGRFALLADPTRLHILSAVHEHGEVSVSEVAEIAGTSIANASQHLRRLSHGGMLGRRRDGQTIWYRVIDDTVEQLCAIVCASLDARRGPRYLPSQPLPHDHQQNDRQPNDEQVQDRQAQDRQPQDRQPQDQQPHDRQPQDQQPHDQQPQPHEPHEYEATR